MELPFSNRVGRPTSPGTLRGRARTPEGAGIEGEARVTLRRWTRPGRPAAQHTGVDTRSVEPGRRLSDHTRVPARLVLALGLLWLAIWGLQTMSEQAGPGADGDAQLSFVLIVVLGATAAGALGLAAVRQRRLVAQVARTASLTEELEAQRAACAEALDRSVQVARDLETATRARGEFLSAMSHELRTPLNAVTGYVELMEMGLRGPVTPTQMGDLERIRSNSQHLLGILTGILNFARLEEQVDVPLQTTPTPFAPLLRETVAAVAERAEAARLTVSLGNHTPESWVARVDPNGVQDVLLHLLANAIKFTPAGGEIQVEARLEPRPGSPDEATPLPGATLPGESSAPAVAPDTTGTAPLDQVLVLRVTDSGRGVPAERTQDVFEPFVQLDRHLVHSSRQGVGLGLPVSRALVMRMGGTIELAAAPAQGTQVTVRLPV